MQNLKEIFDLFDKEKNQTINVKDLETIMGSLQRDPAEVREFIDDLGQEISFDQFIDLIEGNRKYVRCLFVYNKVDMTTIEECDRILSLP